MRFFTDAHGGLSNLTKAAWSSRGQGDRNPIYGAPLPGLSVPGSSASRSLPGTFRVALQGTRQSEPCPREAPGRSRRLSQGHQISATVWDSGCSSGYQPIRKTLNVLHREDSRKVWPAHHAARGGGEARRVIKTPRRHRCI